MHRSPIINYHRQVRSVEDPLPSSLQLPSGQTIELDVRADESAQPLIVAAFNNVRARIRTNERRAVKLSLIRAQVREAMYTEQRRIGPFIHKDRQAVTFTDMKRTFKATRHLHPVA